MIHRRLSPVHTVALHSHHCRVDGDVDAGRLLRDCVELCQFFVTWYMEPMAQYGLCCATEPRVAGRWPPVLSGSGEPPWPGSPPRAPTGLTPAPPVTLDRWVSSMQCAHVLCALRSSFIKQIGSYFERLETEKNKSLPNPSEMTAFTYGSKWLHQDSSSSLQHSFSGLPLGAPCVCCVSLFHAEFLC